MNRAKIAAIVSIALVASASGPAFAADAPAGSIANKVMSNVNYARAAKAKKLRRGYADAALPPPPVAGGVSTGALFAGGGAGILGGLGIYESVKSTSGTPGSTAVFGTPTI